MRQSYLISILDLVQVEQIASHRLAWGTVPMKSQTLPKSPNGKLIANSPIGPFPSDPGMNINRFSFSQSAAHSRSQSLYRLRWQLSLGNLLRKKPIGKACSKPPGKSHLSSRRVYSLLQLESTVRYTTAAVPDCPVRSTHWTP